MAVRNSFAVYIDGINRTSRTVMPLKWAELLDERLDECYLSLRGIKKKNFAPLTPVEIVLSNKLYWSKGGEGEEMISDPEKRTKRFIVADDNTTENPVGSGRYDHELYLLEVTKYMERVVADTVTFTNDIGRDYTENAKPVMPEET